MRIDKERCARALETWWARNDLEGLESPLPYEYFPDEYPDLSDQIEYLLETAWNVLCIQDGIDRDDIQGYHEEWELCIVEAYALCGKTFD